jgi:hypothetical protein
MQAPLRRKTRALKDSPDGRRPLPASPGRGMEASVAGRGWSLVAARGALGPTRPATARRKTKRKRVVMTQNRRKALSALVILASPLAFVLIYLLKLLAYVLPIGHVPEFSIWSVASSRIGCRRLAGVGRALVYAWLRGTLPAGCGRRGVSLCSLVGWRVCGCPGSPS